MTELKLKIIENVPRVSSLIIAENSNNQHKAIMQLSKKYLNELKQFGRVEFEMETFQTNGGVQKREVIYLNEQQTYLLFTFMRNNQTIIKFKIALIQAFFKMRESLTNHSNTNKVYVTLSDSKVREAFFIAFDGKCYYSKEQLTKTHFHIDHILPKSKGGEDILSNLEIVL